jgi:hypothetical protein
MEQLMEWIKPLVEMYAGSLGPVVQLIAIVGTLRLVIKPLMEAFKAVVAATPSKSDDELPSKVEASSVYKTVLFVLDWLASLKLKK